MKTVKVKFVGKWDGIKPEDNLICYWLMKNGYDVQVSEEADYIICDVFGEDLYEYCKYPQVRILETGENYTPDFNVVDYAICRYPIQFQDRCFYLPGCTNPGAHWHALANRDRKALSADFIKEKEYFANFIFGHESENEMRSRFFHKLSAYKRIESCGTFLNNMPDGKTVDWVNESKTDFQRKCKFTICFESTSHNGFTTEKITDAFFADTIPVYYGNPEITKIFNPAAFINVSDFDSLDAVVDKIIEIDQDDEKYLEMMRQPVLLDRTYPKKLDQELEKFVLSIFEQPLDRAYRRSRVYYPKWHDEYFARAMDPQNVSAKRLLDCLFAKLKEKTKKNR